jgi:hypothetical protein
MRLSSYPWTTLALGIKPKLGFRRKLADASIAWYDFKIASLATRIWSSLPDPVNPGGVLYFLGKRISFLLRGRLCSLCV